MISKSKKNPDLLETNIEEKYIVVQKRDAKGNLETKNGKKVRLRIYDSEMGEENEEEEENEAVEEKKEEEAEPEKV